MSDTYNFHGVVLNLFHGELDGSQNNLYQYVCDFSSFLDSLTKTLFHYSVDI